MGNLDFNTGRFIVAALTGLALIGLPTSALAAPPEPSPVAASAQTDTPVIANRTATAITGKVLTAKGKPAKGGFVQIWTDVRDSSYQGSSQDLGSSAFFVAAAAISKNGTYRVTGLKPSTRYHVVAGAAGHLTTWLPRLAGNFTPGRQGVTTTGMAGSVTTARTIKLRAGGVTIKGKIAGFKSGDIAEVAAFPVAPPSTRPAGVSKSIWKKGSYYFNDGSDGDHGLIGYIGHVFADGSYIIPGVTSQVMQIRASNSFGQRIAFAKMPATGRAKVNLSALPRNQLIDSGSAESTLNGYFAPGFVVNVTTARVATSPAGGTPTASIIWTDGLTILGRGHRLVITTAMVGHKVWPVLRWHVEGRDRGIENYRDKVAPVTAIPLQGALTDTEPRLQWGEPLTAGKSPQGWTNTYQWYCGTKPIANATDHVYTPSAEDVACSRISARVNAAGPQGQTGSAYSPSNVKIIAKDGFDMTGDNALIIQGKAKIGQTLTIATPIPAEWAAKYAWLRDGKPIRGAKASTYRLTKIDRNHAISLAVTTTRVGYDINSSYSANAILFGKVKPKINLNITSLTTDTPVTKIKTGQGWLTKIHLYCPGTVSSFPVGGTFIIKYDNQTARVPAAETVVFEMLAIADPGTYNIQISYSGDGTLTKAKSRTLKLKVVR